MSAEITETAGGIITARITGTLTPVEMGALQKAAGDLIRQERATRLLVVVENFEGWQRGADWGDVSFSAKHDDKIEKMAIVGDRKWEELVFLFTAKGVRKFPIEYFDPADMAKARAWLTEKSGES